MPSGYRRRYAVVGLVTGLSSLSPPRMEQLPHLRVGLILHLVPHRRGRFQHGLAIPAQPHRLRSWWPRRGGGGPNLYPVKPTMRDRDSEWQAEEDWGYLLGGGRWHDDGDFVAARRRWICWRYVLQSRRRQLATPTTAFAQRGACERLCPRAGPAPHSTATVPLQSEPLT